MIRALVSRRFGTQAGLLARLLAAVLAAALAPGAGASEPKISERATVAPPGAQGDAGRAAGRADRVELQWTTLGFAPAPGGRAVLTVLIPTKSGWNQPSTLHPEQTFVDPAFLTQMNAARPLVLTHPAGAVVVHRVLDGGRAQVVLTRVDGASNVLWSLHLPPGAVLGGEQVGKVLVVKRPGQVLRLDAATGAVRTPHAR